MTIDYSKYEVNADSYLSVYDALDNMKEDAPLLLAHCKKQDAEVERLREALSEVTDRLLVAQAANLGKDHRALMGCIHEASDIAYKALEVQS